MTRDEFLTAVAELHTKWALKHGDEVPYIAADENPHSGQRTDLAIWQADRSAPAEIDDPLNAALLDLLEQYQGSTVAAAATAHRGGMVALVPTAEDAERLTVPGGEPAEQLHTTLIYLDETTDPETWSTVVDLCESLAAELGPVEADGFAVSVFDPDTEDACVVLGLSGDELANAYDRVSSLLHMAGVDMSGQREPWVPHLTLVYTQDGAELVGQVADRVGPVLFDRLRVAFGGDVLDFPVGGEVLVALALIEEGYTDDQPTPPVLLAHLPSRHDQKSHGRGRRAELDADGIPMGFDVAGLAGVGGWPDDRSELAEVAQAAHRAGFDGVRYEASVGAGHMAVNPAVPRTLLMSERDRWSEEWYQRVSTAPGPHGQDQTFWMPQSRGSSQAGYLIDHEFGHSVAFENGQHTAGYPRMKRTITDVAAELGVKVVPVDFEMDTRPGGTIRYVRRVGATGRPLTADDVDNFMSLEVNSALGQLGLSWKASHGPAEMYAELWAAWRGGSDARVVVAVAETEDWTR